MVFDSLADRAEHHAVLSQLLSVGGGNGHAIEDGIDSHIAEPLLLAQRDAELVEGFEQLGIHLVKARYFCLLLRCGVINDVLIVNLRVAHR